jgi:hypothetical protein
MIHISTVSRVPLCPDRVRDTVPATVSHPPHPRSGWDTVADTVRDTVAGVMIGTQSGPRRAGSGYRRDRG